MSTSSDPCLEGEGFGDVFDATGVLLSSFELEFVFSDPPQTENANIEKTKIR
jgi:hypothetical protein